MNTKDKVAEAIRMEIARSQIQHREFCKKNKVSGPTLWKATKGKCITVDSLFAILDGLGLEIELKTKNN